MVLTRTDVEQIAHLARLEITDAQVETYQQQLSDILKYAEMLNELDLDGIEPTTHAVPMVNVLRADVVETALAMDDVLQNAPREAENQFVIQAVLDE